ncbi:hypothetical protein O6H91_11G062200 [Diphasiastrum complanatum]|uniref:Uncharacterized protein n=1 Tax=Diphasiastrum complanatum TaxID=34168 RepID=A0ACC2C9V8_DIPCM|nr:hypothetical protein O6H91_11G062200 [Diphasiastrum complanatum]
MATAGGGAAEGKGKGDGGGVGGKGWRWPRYNSPLVQVCIIGAVCFCCPGMFNVLSGLGGGGQVSNQAANNALTALYATFAVFGVLGGGIYNLFGPRICLFSGCTLYILYVGSFLNYNHTQNEGFVVAAGALLGVGAGLLWAGQGAIVTSYPPPQSKGRYISIFWCIFNSGGVVGAFVPFVLNYNRQAGSVNDATYVAFMVIMSLGVLLTLTLATTDRVVRDDGSRVATVRYSNPLVEGWEILKLFRNPQLMMLFPACFASNFFYTYQFNNVNGLLFNIRTRSFNNVFYWGAQMAGSLAIGFILDRSNSKRRTRGFIGLSVMAIFTTVVWGGALVNQLHYSRHKHPSKLLDFKDSGSAYAGPFLLYSMFGLLDSMYQTLCYWIIGTLSQDSKSLSRYSGFYKGVQSVGAAIAWQVDQRGMPLLWELLFNWILLTISFPFVALVLKDVKEARTGKVEMEGMMGALEEVPRHAQDKDRDNNVLDGRSDNVKA